MSQTMGGPLVVVWIWSINLVFITGLLTVPAFWWASAHDVPPPIQRDPTVAAIAIASQALGWGLFILANVLIRRRGTKNACLAVHERGFCVSVRSEHHLCLFDEVESIQVGRKLAKSGLEKTADVAMALKPAHRELVRAMQATMVEIAFLDQTRKRLRFSTAGYEGDDVHVFWQHVADRLPQRLFIEGRPA